MCSIVYAPYSQKVREKMYIDTVTGVDIQNCSLYYPCNSSASMKSFVRNKLETDLLAELLWTLRGRGGPPRQAAGTEGQKLHVPAHVRSDSSSGGTHCCPNLPVVKEGSARSLFFSHFCAGYREGTPSSPGPVCQAKQCI